MAVRYVCDYALASIARYEEAEASHREGLRISGRTDAYRFLFLVELGMIRARRGDVDQAIVFGEQAAAVLPEHGAPRDLLGVLYGTKFASDPRRNPLRFVGSMLRMLVRPDG